MTGKNRKKTSSKKHSQPASSSNDSQGSEQGSVDTVDLIGTDPKYDINSPEFETAFKALMDDIGVDMNVIDELSDVQIECVKMVTVATKFDRSQTYNALSLMKPTMKDQSSSTHQAPCSSIQRALEKVEAFNENIPSSDLTELVNVLKLNATWNEPVVKAYNKQLNQAGTSIQKIIIFSTDYNLNTMGAGLSIQSMLESRDTSTGQWFSWAKEIENDEKKYDLEENYKSYVRSLPLWTPRPTYAPLPQQLSDIIPHVNAMLPKIVLQIIARFNSNVARELTELGMIREKSVVALKLCMVQQESFVRLTTTAMHQLVSKCPWANVALSKMAFNYRHLEEGRSFIIPTNANALCMLVNGEAPHAAIQCLQTLQLSFPERSLYAYTRDITTLMRPPLAATGVSAGLAMFEDATQSLIDLAATTTSPVMVQICDAFVSPEFKLVALTEWIRNAPDCPSIADNPVVVAEWALVADHLNALKVDNAKQAVDDILNHLSYRVRNNQLGPSTQAHAEDFPAPELPAQELPLVLAAAAEKPAPERPPLTNKRAGEAIADFDEANGTSSVTLGDDGSYTVLNNGRVHFKIWSKMNSFQRLAMRYLRKEWLENGGAGAEEVVEDRRPSQAPSSAPPSQLQHSTRTNDEPHASRRQPRTRTNNKPPASQTQPRTRVDIVELPEPRPLAPLAMGGMTQAQIDTMMATLQTQSEVLKRTQEQQAASNAQIMHMQSSMAFLADTMKKFQDNSNNEQSDEENDEDGELSNMESCD